MSNERDKDLVETILDVKKIFEKWNDIMNLTYTKQLDMADDNLIFSNQTKQKDADFKERIEEFHAAFMKRGPHSREVNIEEGFELYEE